MQSFDAQFMAAVLIHKLLFLLSISHEVYRGCQLKSEQTPVDDLHACCSYHCFISNGATIGCLRGGSTFLAQENFFLLTSDEFLDI